MESFIDTPDVLSIEPCTHCQLHCPGCPNMDTGKPPGMGWGRLEFDHFRRVIDANPEIKKVFFHCFGEVFINKDVPRMLDYGAERGLRFKFSSSNFNHVSEATLERLVRHGVEEIVVAADGATPDTYAIYRRKGSFERVMANVRRLNELKQKHQSSLPRIVWLWVVFGHNQHEIPLAKGMARDLGMTFHAKMQWDSEYSPIRDPEQLKIELGWDHDNREDQVAVTGDHYMKRVCLQLWQSPKINWDGSVSGCCWTQDNFGGNAFKDGYQAAINNEKIVYARQMLAGEAIARKDIPCTNCALYQKRLAKGNFVTQQEVENESFAP